MTETYDDRYNKSENATRYIKQRVSDISPTLDSSDESSNKNLKLKPALWTSILAGGLAGAAVDFSLYPLDTIKTRLQSKEGFRSSGGFKKLYKGIIPVLMCSAPLSALFFGVYNTLINTLRTDNSYLNPLVYLAAAPAAELICSVFRVPIEIIKQRKQTSNSKSFDIIKITLKEEGFRGFYRGSWSLIMREIPFAAIQYPLWEYMIHQLLSYENVEVLTALETAFCGAGAGAIAAILTTPVDVVKTRIMLARKSKIEMYKSGLNYNFAKEIYHDRGISGFFAGVTPRTLWIMIGGFIYFGAYEQAKLMCEEKALFNQNAQKLPESDPSSSWENSETSLQETAIKEENMKVQEKFEKEENTNKIEKSDNIEKTDKVEKTEKKIEIKLEPQEQNIVDTTMLPPSESP